MVGILTMTNLLGGFTGLAGLWLLAGLLGIGGDRALTAGWLIRAGLAAAGGAAGVIATFRWTGISLWDTPHALGWLPDSPRHGADAAQAASRGPRRRPGAPSRRSCAGAG